MNIKIICTLFFISALGSIGVNGENLPPCPTKPYAPKEGLTLCKDGIEKEECEELPEITCTKVACEQNTINCDGKIYHINGAHYPDGFTISNDKMMCKVGDTYIICSTLSLLSCTSLIGGAPGEISCNNGDNYRPYDEVVSDGKRSNSSNSKEHPIEPTTVKRGRRSIRH